MIEKMRYHFLPYKKLIELEKTTKDDPDLYIELFKRTNDLTEYNKQYIDNNSALKYINKAIDLNSQYAILHLANYYEKKNMVMEAYNLILRYSNTKNVLILDRLLSYQRYNYGMSATPTNFFDTVSLIYNSNHDVYKKIEDFKLELKIIYESVNAAFNMLLSLPPSFLSKIRELDEMLFYNQYGLISLALTQPCTQIEKHAGIKFSNYDELNSYEGQLLNKIFSCLNSLNTYDDRANLLKYLDNCSIVKMIDQNKDIKNAEIEEQAKNLVYLLNLSKQTLNKIKKEKPNDIYIIHVLLIKDLITNKNIVTLDQVFRSLYGLIHNLYLLLTEEKYEEALTYIELIEPLFNNLPLLLKIKAIATYHLKKKRFTKQLLDLFTTLIDSGDYGGFGFLAKDNLNKKDSEEFNIERTTDQILFAIVKSDTASDKIFALMQLIELTKVDNTLNILPIPNFFMDDIENTMYAIHTNTYSDFSYEYIPLKYMKYAFYYIITSNSPYIKKEYDRCIRVKKTFFNEEEQKLLPNREKITALLKKYF